LFEEKDLEKALADRHIDLDLALSAADKVSDFLDKNLEKPFERYMVARLVSILYEETLDCSLGPEFEAKIRSMAKQKPEESNAE
jgi:hypothetical protein